MFVTNPRCSNPVDHFNITVLQIFWQAGQQFADLIQRPKADFQSQSQLFQDQDDSEDNPISIADEVIVHKSQIIDIVPL